MAAKKEYPHVIANRLAKLTPQEREEVRAFLLSRTWLKLHSIVACMKPSPHCKNAGSGERDQFSDARANARLGELRGWEMFEGAIALAILEPAVIKTAVAETFPDSARVDADWGRIPQT